MANLPPEALALLDAIASTESPGYNVIYGGGRFDSYADHPRQDVEITSGPNKGNTSSAAGRYQFLKGTWKQAQRALGLPDFSPPSQDQAAWWLAQRDYRDRTGRNLLSDLRSGDPERLAKIGTSLSGTWTSLPKGIESTTNTSRFASAYQQNYNKRSGADIASRIRPRADLEALRQGMSPVGKMPMRQELGAFVTPKPETMSPGMREKAGASQSVRTAAGNAWDGTASPPLPRRRPDNNPRPPAFIPSPPVPAPMPPRIQQARTGNHPPLPAPAPLANPMAVAYAPPDGSATLAPASVPMYRPGWRDAPEYGSANASLSAVGAGQKVGEAASGAWKGRPPVPRITQAGYTPLSGTVSGLIDGTINEITLPRPVTQTASAVPPSGFIQGVDPTQRPNFIPVPQGSRPNVPEIPGLPWLSSSSAIPARMGATQVADAARTAWQQASPPRLPSQQTVPAIQPPIPMPYPAFRTPQAPPNWLQNMGAGLNKMQQQVAGMLPKPSTEPTWFEQQTGNPGSRGPTMLQMLGMINTQRLLNGQAGNRPATSGRPMSLPRGMIPGVGSVGSLPQYVPTPTNSSGETIGRPLNREPRTWFEEVTGNVGSRGR